MSEQQASARLRRSDRLLQSRDFQRVARHGRRAASRDLVMLIAPTRACADRPEWIRRLGITASRKVGNAVVRNRIKRGIREWFRSSRASFEGDFDVVVIARRGASQLRGDELGSGLSALIAQLNTQLDTHLTTALNTQLKTKRSGPARETAHG